jgi:hypothetical protein
MKKFINSSFIYIDGIHGIFIVIFFVIVEKIDLKVLMDLHILRLLNMKCGFGNLSACYLFVGLSVCLSGSVPC